MSKHSQPMNAAASCENYLDLPKVLEIKWQICRIRVFPWAVFSIWGRLCVAEGNVMLMEGCLQTSPPGKGTPKGSVRADTEISWGWAKTAKHWNSGCWSFFPALGPAQSVWSVSCWLAVSGRELGKGEFHSASNNFTPALLNRASVLCKKRGERSVEM